MMFVCLTACGKDSAAPEPFGGTYGLRRVNGAQLPATIFSNAPSRQDIVSGKLEVVSPASLQVVVVVNYVDSPGGAGSQAPDTSAARYELTNGRLDLSTAGVQPLKLSTPARVLSDGSIVITLNRQIPPSAGVLGTYGVDLIFSR